MRTLVVLTIALAGLRVAAAPLLPPELETVLQRAGERVEGFFARAQSLVCVEIVHLQPLSSGWGHEGFSRTVESELRLSWDPGDDGTAATEARMLRQLLRVNGRAPRPKDWNNCTEPEQQTEEPQPLSLLLAARRIDYAFKLAGQRFVDGRPVVLIDYRLLTRVSVTSEMVEGRDDCVRYDVDGGMRGRIWIDAETYEVLRLDQHLTGMVDVPLPRLLARRPGSSLRFTLERLDTSIRFKPVTFTHPDENLLLPATMTSLRITRGAGTPRLRTTTQYTNYRRFLTGGRVVGQP